MPVKLAGLLATWFTNSGQNKWAWSNPVFPKSVAWLSLVPEYVAGFSQHCCLWLIQQLGVRCPFSFPQKVTSTRLQSSPWQQKTGGQKPACCCGSCAQWQYSPHHPTWWGCKIGWRELSLRTKIPLNGSGFEHRCSFFWESLCFRQSFLQALTPCVYALYLQIASKLTGFWVH